MSTCSTVVNIDNAAAIDLATRDQVSAWNKQIEMKIHHIRDLLKSGQLTLLYIPSGMELADVFTKRMLSIECWTGT